MKIEITDGDGKTEVHQTNAFRDAGFFSGPGITQSFKTLANQDSIQGRTLAPVFERVAISVTKPNIAETWHRIQYFLLKEADKYIDGFFKRVANLYMGHDQARQWAQTDLNVIWTPLSDLYQQRKQREGRPPHFWVHGKSRRPQLRRSLRSTKALKFLGKTEAKAINTGFTEVKAVRIQSQNFRVPNREMVMTVASKVQSKVSDLFGGSVPGSIEGFERLLGLNPVLEDKLVGRAGFYRPLLGPAFARMVKFDLVPHLQEQLFKHPDKHIRPPKNLRSLRRQRGSGGIQ